MSGRHKVQVGENIQVQLMDKSCCGVLKQGWEGIVTHRIPLQNYNKNIMDALLVLQDGSLTWESNVVRMLKEEHYKHEKTQALRDKDVS